MRKITFITIIYCAFTLLTYGQEKKFLKELSQRDCEKLSTASLSKAKYFCEKSGWKHASTSSDIYFEYKGRFNSTAWENPLGKTLVMYYTDDFPSNVIVYTTTNSSWNRLESQLMKSGYRKSAQRDQVGNTIVTYSNDVTQFEMIKNNQSICTLKVLDITGYLIKVKQLKEEEQKKQAEILALENKLREEEQRKQAEILALENKYDEAVEKGDAAYQSGRYESALKNYAIALNIKPDYFLENKMALARNKIKELTKAKVHLEQGKSFLQKKMYANALEEFQESYSIVETKEALSGIEKTEQILEIIKMRKTVFSYQTVEPLSYKKLTNNCLKQLEDLIQSNRTGSIDLTQNIKFDTSGINQSTTVIKSSSISRKEIELDFQKLLNDDILIKPIKSGFRIAATDKVELNLTWTSHYAKYLYKPKGINLLNQADDSSNSIKRYILRSEMYGQYQFKVTNKTLNGFHLQDIDLVNYRTRGPVNVIYSILIPGLGSLRTSYGEKGKGRLALFYTGLGTTLLSTLLSEAYYQEYLKDPDPNSAAAETNYSYANNLNKVSIVTAGISTTLYLYDILWSFGKGVKNIRQGKIIRNQIISGKNLVQNQKLEMR